MNKIILTLLGLYMPFLSMSISLKFLTRVPFHTHILGITDGTCIAPKSVKSRKRTLKKKNNRCQLVFIKKEKKKRKEETKT